MLECATPFILEYEKLGFVLRQTIVTLTKFIEKSHYLSISVCPKSNYSNTKYKECYVLGI
jgi:hypothetical protein